jgi:nitronate monooxygenase
MPLPANLAGRLGLPAVVAPMFLVSGPDLVVESCRAGLLGTFPALNQRTTAGYAEWLDEIEARLAEHPGATPYGVNLIVHRSNRRLDADLALTVARRVPVVITSLGAAPDVVAAVHAYGGLVFHDVISRRHAEKAAEAGVDGIIAVSAGAGGHAGTLSPFALVAEIRAVFAGTILLAGALSTGADIAAARMLGADLAYLGTRFIATREAMAPEGHKRMILASAAGDVRRTAAVSGVPANFLVASLVAAGVDPDAPGGPLDLGAEARAWRDIWSAGQGVGAITDIPAVAVLAERLGAEYAAAFARPDPFAAALAG